VAAPVQRPPTGRPVPVAADTRRLRQCPRRTPTVRTSTVRTPTLRTATAVPDAAADSPGVRGVRFRSHPDTGHSVRLPGRLRRDCRGPQPPFRHHGSAAQLAVARLRWSRGQVDATGGYRLSGCVDTGRGLPGARTPRHCGHLRPRQGVRTLRQRDRNGTAMCGTGQHRCLTARSVAWCSASIWSAPDGSALLTLGASSIQTDREGPHRIVRMIYGMIKHLDRSTAGMVRVRGRSEPSTFRLQVGRKPSNQAGQPITRPVRIAFYATEAGVSPL
jgi:hypothetical protein